MDGRLVNIVKRVRDVFGFLTKLLLSAMIILLVLSQKNRVGMSYNVKQEFGYMKTKNNGSPQCPYCGESIILGDEIRYRHSKDVRCPNPKCKKKIVIHIATETRGGQLVRKYIERIGKAHISI